MVAENPPSASTSVSSKWDQTSCRPHWSGCADQFASKVVGPSADDRRLGERARFEGSLSGREQHNLALSSSALLERLVALSDTFDDDLFLAADPIAVTLP